MFVIVRVLRHLLWLLRRPREWAHYRPVSDSVILPVLRDRFTGPGSGKERRVCVCGTIYYTFIKEPKCDACTKRTMKRIEHNTRMLYFRDKRKERMAASGK